MAGSALRSGVACSREAMPDRLTMFQSSEFESDFALGMDNATLARATMGTSLGFHIVFAVLGVGLPLLMSVAEGLALWRRDEAWMLLAKRWSKAFGILFAVGAFSGRSSGPFRERSSASLSQPKDLPSSSRRSSSASISMAGTGSLRSSIG